MDAPNDPTDASLWPELGSLDTSFEPLPDIPADLIPKPLRAWIQDAATRLGVPTNAIYTAALVGAGALIGNAIRIYPRAHDTSWTEPANLWGVLIAPPSTKKTPIASHGLAFVRELDTANVRNHEQEAASQRASLGAIETRIKAQTKALDSAESKGDAKAIEFHTDALRELEQQRDTVQSTRPQLIANDVTVEVLQVLMHQNPNGILFIRDELSGLLEKMESHGHENDRAFFAEAYNANAAYTVNRIGRPSIRIEQPTLSLYGAIQPSVIKPLVAQTIRAAGGDGFLARCQLAIIIDPSSVSDGVDREVDIAAEATAREAYAAVHHVAKTASEQATTTPWVLRFTPEAQKHMDAWRAALDAELRSGELDAHPAYLAHLGKAGAAACRLALTIQLLSNGHSATRNSTISLEAAQQATGLMDHLRLHALRLYAVDEPPHLDDARYLMRRILDGKLRDGVSVREIQQACSRFATSDQAKAALCLLEMRGIVRLENHRRSGAASTIVRVHPTLLAPGNEKCLN